MTTEVVVRGTLAVPQEEVFDAWLDAPGMAGWMCPGEGTARAEIDARVGGKFRLVMTHGDASTEHTGEYLKIERPSLLSFTWKSSYTDNQPTVVTIEFREQGAGTELVLTHRRLPPTRVDGHRDGWMDILRKLNAALTR
jgi:uncharacterized protein YndB with AHSA1/START domain